MDTRRQGKIVELQYIVDASVAVKWVLSGEPFEEKAVMLKDRHVSRRVTLFAPSFMVQEVANSLWKAIIRNRITQIAAKEALENLNGLTLEFRELNWSHASETLDIACKLDITVYDAAYLFLANQLDADLITADDKLYKKAHSQFKILHIKDYI
jgi:predicted nucleic acid-binding protein